MSKQFEQVETDRELNQQAGFYAGVAAMAIVANRKLSEWGVTDDILNKLANIVSKVHPDLGILGKQLCEQCSLRGCEKGKKFDRVIECADFIGRNNG